VCARHVQGRAGVKALGRASADVEVLLAVVAVVAEMEDPVVGQATDGPIGVVVVRDMEPQCGAAGAGVAEVELDGLGVVSDGTGEALGEAAPRGRHLLWRWKGSAAMSRRRC